MSVRLAGTARPTMLFEADADLLEHRQAIANMRMAKAILRLIERTFGPLNDADRQRVLEAKPTQLETWADRIIDAVTIKQIFKH
jgi:hypothetical protein